MSTRTEFGGDVICRLYVSADIWSWNRPKPALTAVLPLPNKSHAKPSRGSNSLVPGVHTGSRDTRIARHKLALGQRWKPPRLDACVVGRLIELRNLVRGDIGERDQRIPSQPEIYRDPTVNLEVILEVRPIQIPAQVYVQRCDLVEGRWLSVQEVRHVIAGGNAPKTVVVSIGLEILVNQAELSRYIETECQRVPALDPGPTVCCKLYCVRGIRDSAYHDTPK